MKERTSFTCNACRKSSFHTADWTHESAVAEFKANWGREPTADEIANCSVCDDCYKEMMGALGVDT